MDNETAQAFAKVLQYITNSLGEAIENNGESVMNYLGQLGDKIIAYKSGISYLWFGFATLLLIIAIIAFIVYCVKDNGFAAFISIVALCVSVAIAMYWGYQLIACKTFPEKIILEYIQETYKTIKNTNSSTRY